MLTHLLAAHPDTSAGTLTELMNSPDLPPDALATVLTHPALPPDAPLPPRRPDGTDRLEARGIHQVLTCARTSESRRAEVLGGLTPYTLAHVIGDYDDLRSHEITELVATVDFAVHWRLAAAVARNPATPEPLVHRALRALAANSGLGLRPLTIAILAAQRGVTPQLLAELGQTLAERHPLDDALTYFDGTDTTSPVRRAADSGYSHLTALITQTRSVELMTIAVREERALANFVCATLPTDHPHDELRSLLDAALPTHGPTRRSVLAALDNVHATGTGNLEIMLDDPLLAADALRAVTSTVAHDPAHRGPDGAALLRLVAVHPNCPHDLLPAIDTATRTSPEPPEPVDWHDNRVTYHLARARLARDPLPGLAVPVPLLRDVTHVTDEDITASYIRAATDAHQSWPLNPTATQVLLALNPTFTGTVGELLASIDAVAA